MEWWFTKKGLIPKKNWEQQILELKKPVFDKSESDIVAELKEKVLAAVKSRVPNNERFAILFSGGVDSTLIAFLCKQWKCDFVCYSVGAWGKKMKYPEDLEWAKKIARELRLEHKEIILNLEKSQEIIRKTGQILGPKWTNVVNIGVGSVEIAVLEQLKKDKIRFAFGGLGSEELFAGYERHEKADDVVEESWNGLINMYERDLVRESKIFAHYQVEASVPFLDKKLIEYTMQIPAKYKLDKNHKKIILRKAAVETGLPELYAWRPKRAAQYGSRFDSILTKLARKKKMKKSEFLENYINQNS